MTLWWHFFRADLTRCLGAPTFALAVLLIGGTRLVGIVQEVLIVGDVNVLYLHALGEFSVAVTFLGPLVYSTAFVSDYQSGFMSYCVKRGSIPGYAWSKISCVALTSALATVLGLGLFYGLLAIRFPIVQPDGTVQSLGSIAPYGALLLTGHPRLYLAVMTLLDALLSAVLAASAICLSCFIPNLFVALCSPILVYYLAINAFPYGRLSPYRVLVTASVDMGGVGLSLLYAAAYAAACVAVLGFIFAWGVRRRVAYG